MGRKHVAEDLLRDGLYPSLIAERMGISVKSVVQYLQTRVGEGAIRLSDIYFSWPPEKRALLQRIQKDGSGLQGLSANHLSHEELELFASLREVNVFYGDLYEYTASVEITIHDLVRRVLQEEYGPGETGWWRKGIPEPIRKQCVSRREEDEDPSEDAFSYTTMIDLSEIISKKWSVFQAKLPTEYGADRKRLEQDLRKLNHIRNAVMHPVKSRKWSEQDFEFVRGIASSFGAIAPISG